VKTVAPNLASVRIREGGGVLAGLGHAVPSIKRLGMEAISRPERKKKTSDKKTDMAHPQSKVRKGEGRTGLETGPMPGQERNSDTG